VQKMESRCNVAGIKTNLFRSPAAATAMWFICAEMNAYFGEQCGNIGNI
jgi:hypothetical protein